ncbi:hypothetical protein [Sulfurisphaera ohwakuensis]|uniref:hypothetical protein n=1 Tax=Sulfurisphaera ohwakuensis TaxID=69656 RepID=UPI0036F29206
MDNKNSEERKNFSEIIRTLTIVLSQLEFEKDLSNKSNKMLKENIASMILLLEKEYRDYILNNEVSSISKLVEEGKFGEAREKLLEVAYRVLKE